MEALRGDSPRAGKAVDALTSRLMNQFLSIKRFDICLASAVWPIEILACALRSKEDFAKLERHMQRMQSHLDPGHYGRLKAVTLAAKDSVATDDSAIKFKFLPTALSMLAKPDGILGSRSQRLMV